MTARRIVATAALVLAVLAGCGIDPESSAHRVAPDAVPFGLLEDPATAPESSPSGSAVTVYLLADGRLVPVARSTDPRSGLTEVADLLAAGPTRTERALGLTSSLPDDQVLEITPARGVAQVDLAATFADLNPRDQAQAIAQLTYSLTGRPGIGRVAFTLDGAGTEVPRGDGTLTDDPLVREDFETIAPPP